MHPKDYSQQEEALFEEWEQRCSRDLGFVRDGAMDPGRYFDGRRKLLFILKEANDPKRGRWHLREHVLSKDCRWQTWNNIVRWKRVLEAWHADPGQPFGTLWKERLAHLDLADRNGDLGEVALMNLKKVPGLDTAFWEQINEAANRDRAMLEKQLKMLDPDVVTVCGPAPSLAPFLDGTYKDHWKGHKGNVLAKRFPMGGRERLVIWQWHPQARVAARKMAEGMWAALGSL